MPASEQGVDNKRFSVIPRTLVFLFNEKNEVLLLKGAAGKRIWAGKYNGLGGHIESGEDIVEGALRELVEEAGVQGVALWLCGQILVKVSEMQGVAIFVFKGVARNLKIRSSSEGNLEWVSMDQLSEKPLVEDLVELLPRVVKHEQDAPLIIGKYTYNEQDELIISFR